MSKVKILAIDDEKKILNFVTLILEREGFEVIKGLGGTEGLRLANEHSPNLVLLDINMPDINGLEVLEELKKRNLPTRVIMLTGENSLPNVIRYIKAGACNYITKPFEPKELINAIKRALTLESTINLRILQDSPLVNELIASAEKLDEKKIALEKEIVDLREAFAKKSKALQESLKKQQDAFEKKSKTLNAALEKKDRELRKHVERVSTKDQLINLAVRLVFLLAASLVTVIFYQLHILTDTQTSIFLAIALFVLLLFPVDKIKSLYAKHRETETKVEVSSNNNQK